MSKTLEQKLIERLFAFKTREIHKVINNKLDRAVLDIWHRFGKDSDRKESQWFDRQGKNEDYNILGILCLLYGLWGKRGYSMAAISDTFKALPEEHPEEYLCGALKRTVEAENTPLQAHSVDSGFDLPQVK